MPGSKKSMGLDKHGVEKWLFTVYYGTLPNGRPRRYREAFHGSDAESDKALALYYARVVTGQEETARVRAAAGAQTLTEYAEEFLRECVQRQLRPRTIAGYRDHLQNRILPYLGHIPLAELAPRHIREFLRILAHQKSLGKKNAGLISANTVHAHYRTLSALLREAVYDEKISSNPVREVRPPKMTKTAPRFVDSPDLATFLAAIAAEAPREQALWMLALGCGLRRGELAGLRWSQVDWTRRLLHIQNAVSYVPGEGQHRLDTKSEAGRRPIPIPAPVLRALEYNLVQQHLDYRAWQQRHAAHPKRIKPWKGGDGCCFTNEKTGARLHIESISKLYQQFLTRHRLPDVNLHGLRHTAITIWRANGLTDADTIALAGHASKTMTDHYTHALDSHLRRSAEIMEETLTLPP